MKQHVELNGKTILVTGSPGFIGANLVLRLLREMTSGTVVSLDNMNDYYDPALKEYRLRMIEEAAKSSPVKMMSGWMYSPMYPASSTRKSVRAAMKLSSSSRFS